MKKGLILVLMSLVIVSTIKAQVWKDFKKAAEDALEETTKSGFTEEEAGKALKEALVIGIEKGVKSIIIDMGIGQIH